MITSLPPNGEDLDVLLGLILFTELSADYLLYIIVEAYLSSLKAFTPNLSFN